MFKNDFCFTTWLMSSFHLLKIWVIIYDDIQYWDSNKSKKSRINKGQLGPISDLAGPGPRSVPGPGSPWNLDRNWKIEFFQIISTWALSQMKIRSLDSFSLVSHDLILSHDSESRDVLSLYHMMSLHVS